MTWTYILSSSDSLPDRLWSKRAAASDKRTLPSSSNTPRTSPCIYGVSKAGGGNRHMFYRTEWKFRQVSFDTLTPATYFSVVQASLRRGKWPAIVGTNRRLRSPPQKKHCHLFTMHTVRQVSNGIYSRVLEVAYACAKPAAQPVSQSPDFYVIGWTRTHIGIVSPSCGRIQWRQLW